MHVSNSIAFTVADVSVTNLKESNLNKALRNKIALIDGNGAGSVNARIAAEAQARAVVARAAEDAKAAAKKAADDLTTKAAEIGGKIAVVERVNNEQAQQIRTVTAAQGTTAAGLEAEKKARADGDRAEAAARETLAGRVSAAEGNITRETQARVTAINAKTAATEALKTRVGNTESSITALRETVNQKDSSRASEINQLSAKLNNLSVGGRNLIRDSATQVQNSNYLIQSYLMTDNSLQEGEPVTVTIWGDLGSDREAFWPFNSDGRNRLDTMKKVSDGVYRLSATWQRSKNNPSNDRLLIYCRPRSGRTASRIDRIKLERGTVATDWTPAPEDGEATVQVVQTALSKATGDIRALGERIATAQSTADGNTAAVQAHARSINGLEAQYTVKVDVNGKVAGYGLASTPKNGTPESKFIVNADRFGIGAPGKADVFPFTVDTRQNRVGVNGELVVNGKAIVDRLNAGDIHGDKIAANTLNANRLKARSVTAREIGAGAVTADKMNVTSLSAVSSNLGSITGGSLNIGNGNFTVSSDGILTANNAVIRGRIEADSGYFNGTVRASSVEGDVMKAHRLRWTEGNVWVLDLDKDPLPRVLIPNFRVISETYGNKVVQARLMLNGVLLNPLVTKDYELFRRYYWDNAHNSRKPKRGNSYIELTDYRYKTRLEYPIQIIPAGKPISLKLTLASHESVFSPFVSVSYLSQSDYEYKQLLGRMVWRTFAEDFRYDNRRQVYLGGDRRVHNYQNQMRNHWEPYGGLLQLPDNIYGISFEYRLYTNRDWSTMLTFDRSDAYEVVKKYRANGFGPYSLYEREFDTAIPKSNLLFFVEKSWQYIELRNIRVLIPESRENEVWQVG